jgi:hypothetical protein
MIRKGNCYKNGIDGKSFIGEPKKLSVNFCFYFKISKHLYFKLKCPSGGVKKVRLFNSHYFQFFILTET